MEFAEDLQYYYKSGYGYEVTYKQACPLFKDMIEFLDELIISPNYQYDILQFIFLANQNLQDQLCTLVIRVLY